MAAAAGDPARTGARVAVLPAGRFLQLVLQVPSHDPVVSEIEETFDSGPNNVEHPGSSATET